MVFLWNFENWNLVSPIMKLQFSKFLKNCSSTPILSHPGPLVISCPPLRETSRDVVTNFDSDVTSFSEDEESAESATWPVLGGLGGLGGRCQPGEPFQRCRRQCIPVRIHVLMVENQYKIV